MSRAVTMIAILAASLALAACQQQTKPAPQAPAAMQPAPASKPEAPAPQAEAPAPQAPASATAAPSQPVAPKPATTVAKASAPAPSPAKPAATAPEAPKPAASPAPAPVAKPETSAPKPAAMSLPAFSTTRCMACHAIDHDKVGPAWKTVVEKYGDAATLAKDFETGFKERRVANSIAKWKSKEGLMTSQFNNLIKGHEKSAAHALFETVKQGKFGSY